MTPYFYLLALITLCGIIALIQLCYALFHRHTNALPNDDVLPWYEAQQRDLQQQFARHEISEALYQYNNLALQRELLNSQSTSNIKGPSFRCPAIVIILGSIALVSAASVFYWQQGTAKAWITQQQLQLQNQQASALLQTMGGKTQVIAAMQARLRENPLDARGWYLLGRLYFNDNRFNAASDAFIRANRLQPEQSDTLLSLAEALYLSHQPSQVDKAKAILTQLLQREPNNPGALNLSALLAYQAHDYQHAIALWQNLLAQAPAGSETAQALQQAINQARQASA